MGLLISIEGADYVGKTSLAVPGLEAVYSNCGIPVLKSREPGGSPEAETIRTEIFNLVKTDDTSQMELAKLFNKARRIHLDQVIIPFLGAKKENKGIVILDRYLDSTRVYQGMEGKLPLDKIYALEDEFVDGFLPDITFVLYFPEDHIKQYIEIRKRLSQEEKSEHSTRSHTIWDEATLDEYKKRQDYHFRLQEIAKERGEQRLFSYIDASLSPYEIVKQLSEITAKYMMEHKQIELPPGFLHSLSKSLAKVKNSLFMLFAERQWKKQQLLLKNDTM